MVVLGVLNWAVSLYEFVFYQKTPGALLLATVLFMIGFGGLFICNRMRK